MTGSVGKVLGRCIKGYLDRARCAPLFFLPTKLACWHTSLQVEAHNQKDQSVTNQVLSVEYPGLRPDSYL